MVDILTRDANAVPGILLKGDTTGADVQWKGGETSGGGLIELVSPSGDSLVDDTNDAVKVTLATQIDKTNDSILIYANTAKDGSGTDYVPLLDSDGHLQVDLLSTSVDLMLGTDFSNVFGTASLVSATPAVKVEEQGSPTVNLSATDNAVIDAIQAAVEAVFGAAAPTVDSYTNAAINASANTANQSLIAAPGASKQIWVYGIQFTVGTGDGTVSFQDSDDTAISGVMEVSQTSGFGLPPSGNFAMPLWKVATNKALEVDTVTCDIKGSIQYAIISV